MTNPALGTKRNCPKCNAHFYDLNRSPVHCPKCQNQFDPAVVQLRTKKKVIRRTSDEVEIANAEQKLAATKKVEIQKKKDKKLQEEGAASGHEIEEMDELDDIEDIDEINELEEAEDEQLHEDDADDETILEDMDTGGKHLVDNVEEEEAQALVEEIEDEQAEIKKSTKNKKNSK